MQDCMKKLSYDSAQELIYFHLHHFNSDMLIRLNNLYGQEPIHLTLLLNRIEHIGQETSTSFAFGSAPGFTASSTSSDIESYAGVVSDSIVCLCGLMYKFRNFGSTSSFEYNHHHPLIY